MALGLDPDWIMDSVHSVEPDLDQEGKKMTKK
jgi:hypothetical protein